MDRILMEALERSDDELEKLALVVTAPQELPFGDIPWMLFEKLCYRLARLEGELEDLRGYGRPGQADRGIDVLGRQLDGRYTVYQCKRHRRMAPSDVRRAVMRFVEGDWADRTARFVLCTTQSCTNTRVADEIARQAELLRVEHDISFVVWDKEGLSARLKEQPEVVRDVFGPAVLQQFLPGYATVPVRAAPARVTREEDVHAYLKALHEHCTTLPSWFPSGIAFTEIAHEVTVRPPAAEAPEGAETNAPSEAQRRVPWRRALHQLRRVLLIGDPGSGKSWAVRARAVELATARLYGSAPAAPLPIVVLAPKLEEQLRISDADRSTEALAEALAIAMPDDVAASASAVEAVAGALRRREPVDLLIDGYDEIRTQRPRLAQRLGEIVALLGEGSRFVLTTRPATIPQQRFARVIAACELQPFRERDQRAFVETWFRSKPEHGETVGRWVSERRLDLLRTPLLLALFCAASTGSDAAPPQTEPDLWLRALHRLASDEERYGEISETSELLRHRITLLEEIAGVFVTPAGILDGVAVTLVDEVVAPHPAWRQLERLSTHATVIDDLTSTGIVRKVRGSKTQELEFLHSALRDYLLARLLARRASWSRHLWRLWSQPEWEPVIGYVGALVEDPGELLSALQSFFGDDPLNAARLTAGQVIVVAWPRVPDARRNRVRGELLALLASHDEIDRNRSAALLASLQDDETVALIRALLQPDVPTRVVVAALRAIAGGTSAASIEALERCARSSEYTSSERVAAVEALADTSSMQALAALERLAYDDGVAARARAAAAFSALRMFDVQRLAVDLLEGSDDASREARRALAERLVAEEDSLGDFVASLREADGRVSDPYCAALIESSGPDPGDGMERVAGALRSNEAVERMVEAVERLRDVCKRDPLAVTLVRFLLDHRRRIAGRWTLAQHVLATDADSAAEIVRSLGPQLTATEHLDIGEFLVAQIAELPEALGAELRRALENEDFGPFGRVALGNVRGRPPAGAPPPPVAPPPANGARELARVPDDIAGVLASRMTRAEQYQLLRALRRTLPLEGETRRRAASLTHAISIGAATQWIDAQPTLAPLVEDRLRRCDTHVAHVELAELRSRWPGRESEVENTVAGLNARVLDARAEAALLSDDLDTAGTMALASIGTREAQELIPTRKSVTLLLAAGGPRTFDVVDRCLQRMPLERPSTLVLLGWRQAAMRDFAGLATLLEQLPGYLRATDANVAALRVLTGMDIEGAFDRVISWSDCKRVTALLAAVAEFAPSKPLQARIEAARTALEAHAAGLAAGWPADPLEPGDQGTPRWADMLVQIAGDLLAAGQPRPAVAIYEAVVKRQRDHPTLVNNLGFCQIAVDRAAAEQTLDRAAALYTRPFSVNVANRMLVRTLRGDDRGALTIGEAYYEQSATARDVAWLWDIDDPSVLHADVDVLRYIAELGCKAAAIVGDADALDRWSGRLAQRPEEPR